jgi:hypothetical protein
MKVQAVMDYAKALLAAVDQAVAEGRDELSIADLSVFSQADDAARAELEAAIKRANEG